MLLGSHREGLRIVIKNASFLITAFSDFTV